MVHDITIMTIRRITGKEVVVPKNPSKRCITLHENEKYPQANACYAISGSHLRIIMMMHHHCQLVMH